MLIQVATSVVGVVLLGVVLSRISLDTLAQTLSRASIVPLVAAAILTVAATVLRGVRYASLLAPGRGWLRLYGTFAYMRVLNAALPLRTGELAALGLLCAIEVPGLAEGIAAS